MAAPARSSASARRPSGIRGRLRSRVPLLSSLSTYIRAIRVERTTVGVVAFTRCRGRPMPRPARAPERRPRPSSCSAGRVTGVVPCRARTEETQDLARSARLDQAGAEHLTHEPRSPHVRIGDRRPVLVALLTEESGCVHPGGHDERVDMVGRRHCGAHDGLRIRERLSARADQGKQLDRASGHARH